MLTLSMPKSTPYVVCYAQLHSDAGGYFMLRDIPLNY